MDLGFHNVGFDILWANDSNSDCCTTYRKNFLRLTGRDTIHEGDIDTIERPVKKDIGKVTVLLGGFPYGKLPCPGNWLDRQTDY